MKRERAPMPSPLKLAVLGALEQGPMTIMEVAQAVGTPYNTASSVLARMRALGLVESTRPRSVGRGGHYVIYTLKKTAYQEDPGMGDKDKSKSESKPPCPSKEAEECEMDPRNEP